MSISDLQREAVNVRLSRKRDILGRHKEVLSEIFYFTIHPDVPPDSDSSLEQPVEESSDLKEFLTLNDLESGHMFQESTLPKPQTVAPTTSTEAPPVNNTVTNAAPPTPITPQNPNATSQPPQPPSSGSGRMVTRVSSGAIRHKSVGELLGEKEFTPKHAPARSTEIFQDPATIDSLVSGFQESAPAPPKTPKPTTTRPRGTTFQDTSLTTPPSTRVELDRIQAAAEIFPLEHLVSKAHKSVRTTDWTKAMDEKRTVAIVNRIVELKEQNLWSLRQPAKQKAPPRSMVHWDYMLKEMEWMATDFYEERKFKMAGAVLLSRAVREYFKSHDKESLLHKWPRRLRTPVKHFEEDVDADEDVLMVNHRGSASPVSMDNEAEPMREVENPLVNGVAEGPTPMLIDPPKDVKQPEPETLPTPPSSCELEDLPAIFDLPSDVIYASVNELPKKDGSSLSQLPIYGPPVVTDEPYHNPIEDLPIVPISKFCLERYVVPVTNWEPPNRYYRRSTPEHPDDMLDIISKEVQVEAVPTFAPAGTETSHGSRRRSSAIIIRPPAPPTHWNDQKLSPWTPEEERQLLQSAKENMYNFDLVASTLSFSASSISDLERRSAWECFEKFRAIYPEPQNIQLAGSHRNLALSRIDKGIRLNMSSMNRTRLNAIVRQPRLDVRNHRYLNLFDAMKKSAKNREKTKAQEKPVIKKPKDNLPTKPAVNVPTPMDLSRLKAERDRAFNQAILAERQAQAVRLQMPPGASPEVQEEVRRQWIAQQQNALLNGQAIRQNPGLGRGLVIPGARPMPIRPNTGTNPVAGNVPVRLPNGVTATPEQLQQMLKARQLAMAANGQNGTNPPTLQQMQRLRALQQAQLNAAQNAGVQNPGNANGVADYIPFITTNGTTPQAGAAQAGNLQNRLMQPPQQNGAVVPGIRQATPQLQLPQQSPQGLRATPPRPSNLSPTTQHFPVSNPGINLQSVLAYVQQTNPQLSLQDATKVALDQLTRYQQGAQNNLHLQQQLVKSSPTLANQQIRQSPSQNSTTPHAQGQQRMA